MKTYNTVNAFNFVRNFPRIEYFSIHFNDMYYLYSFMCLKMLLKMLFVYSEYKNKNKCIFKHS